MSEKLYKVKPLEWVDFRFGSEAETPFGRYTVELPHPGSARAPYWLDLNDKPTDCASLEAGKAACEAHWMQMLEKIFEPVDIDLEYRRHVEELRKLVGQRSGAEEMPLPKLPAGGPKEGK